MVGAASAGEFPWTGENPGPIAGLQWPGASNSKQKSLPKQFDPGASHERTPGLRLRRRLYFSGAATRDWWRRDNESMGRSESRPLLGPGLPLARGAESVFGRDRAHPLAFVLAKFQMGRRTKKPRRAFLLGGVKINLAIPTFASALTIIGPECLTTVFGMGTGVSTTVWSPEEAGAR